MRALLLGLLLVPLAATAQTATVETIAPPFQPTVIAPDGSAIGGVSTVYIEVDFEPGNPLRYWHQYPAVWVDGQAYRLSIPGEYVPESVSIQVPVWVMYLSEDADLIYGNARVPRQALIRVVRWDGVGASMTFVEGLPQNGQNEMMAASRDGSVLAGVYREFENDFAWRWEDGAVTVLEDFFLDGSTTEILEVDDQGRVFGSRQTFENGGATWTALVWDTDGSLTVGDAFSYVLVGASGDGTTLVVNGRPAGDTRGFLVREDETIVVDSLRLGRTRPTDNAVPSRRWVVPPGNVSHDGTTLYGGFTGDPVLGLPTRSDWLWREGIGRVPIGQLLEEQYGLQIPACSEGSFYGVMSADGRTLTAQCAESLTPEPDETTYVITLPASASWAEAASGFFDDPDRWAPARVPDATTLTRLAATGSDYTVTLRDDQTLPNLTVAVAPDDTAPEATAPTVTLDLDGRTLTLAPQSDAFDALVVGDQGDGTLFLLDGTVDANGGVTLGRAGSAQGRLFSDVTFQIDGPLVVGDGAAGTDETASTLGIIDGTTTAALGFDVGLQAGTNGFIAVESGATLQVPADAPSTIGFAGTGQVIVTEGFLSHTGPLTLGRLASGKGMLNLRSGATALTTDSLVVGLAGIGELEIVGGSGLSTGPAVLGSQAGSVASVRLAGPGSEWDIAGDLLNGLDGAAVLEVIEGASLCVSGLALTGEQGRFVFDDTLVLGVADCAGNVQAGGSSERRSATSSIALGGLTVVAGGEVVAPAIEVGPGGVLDGAGALAVPVTNGGTLAPGGRDALGTLALTAPLTQTADGVLVVEVGTDGSDALAVDGAVTLGGTLRVAALPGSTPMVGASYEVLTAAALTGAFDRIEAPEGLAVTVEATRATVTVTSVVAAEDEATPKVLA